MNVLLLTINTKYIHKALSLRWLYVTRPKNAFVDVKEFTIKESAENICSKLDVLKYDVVGLSVYIWNTKETKELILKLKEIKPSLKIILGGPDVTFENDDWFDYPIDGICLGEGEKVFWEFIETGYSDSVKTKKGEEKVIARTDLKWLEQFENPYFLDFDLEDMSKRYLYLETSRGCPYGCKYCLSETDRRVRAFSDEYIDKIFDRLNDFHFYQIKFLDRTFNLDSKRALRILEKLNQIESVDSFQMELVAETLPDDLIEFMETKMNKDKFRFEVGVQSFNTKTLEAVHRISDLDKLTGVIQRLKKANIVLHTDLIAGLPYEDLESFENSFNSLYCLNTEEVQCGTLKLLKGTTLRKEAEKYNLIYHQESPYEVISTPWISEKDMDVIHMVALGCEKTYNNNRISHTLSEIFSVCDISPFKLFYKLGLTIENLGRPYQLVEYFKAVYNTLQGTLKDDKLQHALLFDYYKNTQTKPKILFELNDTSEVYEYLNSTKKFNKYTLEHYSIVTPVLVDGKELHQLLIYHDRVIEADRYLIDMQGKEVKKIS